MHNDIGCGLAMMHCAVLLEGLSVSLTVAVIKTNDIDELQSEY